MSTSEPPARPPGELQLAEGQAPRANETPTSRAPTPGVALAGARVPGGPTVPDDSAMLAIAIARMANELLVPAPPATVSTHPVMPGAPIPAVAPVSASEPSAPTSTSAPSAPTSTSAPSAPTSTSAPSAPTSPEIPALQSDPMSPFFAPLQLADVDRLDTAGLGAIPLVDRPPVDGRPSSPVDADAPYWFAPTATGDDPPPSTGIATFPFQIEPTSDIAVRPGTGTGFDPVAIRNEFPILQERVHGRRLIWLDNAATTQKPQVVIDRLSHYYEHENSNVHRAAHTLAGRATDAYEAARETVRRFINAPSKNEIVFVRGATEGINLIAQAWGRRNVSAGDEIVITWLEHHANIVPWQQLCSEKGARLRVAPVDDRGQIILEEYEKLLNHDTRIVSLSQVSNALGTITPAREMVELAHRWGAKVVVDGAQAVSHMQVDVQQLDCDFYVFSGHKVFAPTGIGVVFGKNHLLNEMPPWQGGGNMIEDVTFERTIYQPAPARFEAGTGNIADAIGLGTALDWLSRLGVGNVGRYEHELLDYATERLGTVPGLTMIGTAPDKAGVLSFVLAGQKTEEVGGLLDKEGIAVRSGHHCAQPILRRFGLESTVRASLAPYNTFEDIDELVAALQRLQAGRGRPG